MSNNIILSIYKSRTTIVEHLASLGYEVSDYTGFSINEVDTMYRNAQLDMLVSHPINGTKAYVRYSTGTFNKALQNTILNLYQIEQVLTPADTLIVIQDDEPNDSLVNSLTTTYNRTGVFIVVHSLKRLQFNILRHFLVPKYEVLSDAEKERVMKEYSIADISQFPEISRFDPVALAICLRPGNVCRITAASPTAGETVRYRACVQ